MSKRVMITLLLTGVVVGGSWFSRDQVTRAQDKAEKVEKAPAKKPALQKFMRAKLDLSQGLLEGLVTENFELIDKNAKNLLALSIAEEWNISNDPLYIQHSKEFRQTVKQISKMANNKNLDGASLSFVQMTMSCMECHRFVRNDLIAERKKKD